MLLVYSMFNVSLRSGEFHHFVLQGSHLQRKFNKTDRANNPKAREEYRKYGDFFTPGRHNHSKRIVKSKGHRQLHWGQAHATSSHVLWYRDTHAFTLAGIFSKCLVIPMNRPCSNALVMLWRRFDDWAKRNSSFDIYALSSHESRVDRKLQSSWTCLVQIAELTGIRVFINSQK